MKRLLGVTASTLLLVLVLSVSSYGWSDTGHMAVAFVAYQNLTPQARAQVDALIKLNPRFSIWSASIPHGTPAKKKRLMLFMIAATWADQIKSDGVHQADGTDGGDRPPNDGTAARIIGYQDRAMHKYWHFVDLPFSPDNTPLENPPVPNAGTQIPALRMVLAASNSSNALKSYALVWLLHLVGDVHQPLHATSRFIHGLPHGDAGGNFVKLTGQPAKLHQFWDGLLGTSSDPAIAITAGQSLPVSPVAPAADLNPANWINESFNAARTVVYQPPIGIGAGPFTRTQAYNSTAHTLANQRVALAGARLANLLNADLP